MKNFLKKAEKGVRAKFQLQMTPMIDVIFLLLVFFMCCIKFKTLEGKLVSHLPTDIGPNTDEHELTEPFRIRLWLDRPDDPTTLRIAIQRNLCADFEDLHDKLGRFLNNLSVTERQEARVVIDASRDVPFKHVIHVLDICRALDITRTEFAAPPPIENNSSSS